MMQRLEQELRGTKDPRDLERADILTAMLKARGSDIALSQNGLPNSEVLKVEIKRFSQEQKKALEKEGYVVYFLTGQSIKTLRDSGRKFWLTWHNSLPDFEALGSMHSEVAINPSKLFLPKSNNKTLARQEELVEEFSQELGGKVQGVKAIIGEAPDYAELAFAHLDATKEYLFGAKDNYNYARTKTPTGGSSVAFVGRFYAGNGLNVNSWDADGGYGVVRAAPLVVPV